MENSSLNKAHQFFRKADNLVKHRKFDEAAECHKNAAEHLTEALRKAENPRAIESIKLQRDYHLRQKEIVLLKKEQYEKYKKALEYKKNKMQALENKETQDGSPSLQWAIYRAMEETDSLLGLLVKKGSTTNSESESLKSFSASDTDEKDIADGLNAGLILGNKHPKDESTVIEELQILNEQLHTLVFQLVSQLDARTKEVETLTERVQQLEAEKNKSISKSSNNNLKVTMDSSGGTSPFVFSPCSELGEEVLEPWKLPTLAPLEMPTFDIQNFLKSNQTNNASN